jgi:prepilin peptidase CpaA
MIETLIFLVFPFCMLFAAVSDAWSMTIANWVSLVLVAAFAAIAPMTGMEWSVYGLHFAAGFIVLLATFGLFALGGMGGGDAKLMAATAVWMGLDVHLMQYLTISALIGGILTMAILVYRKSTLAVYARGYQLLQHLADEKTGVPYGIALGIGGMIAYADSPLMIWALNRVAA